MAQASEVQSQLTASAGTIVPVEVIDTADHRFMGSWTLGRRFALNKESCGSRKLDVEGPPKAGGVRPVSDTGRDQNSVAITDEHSVEEPCEETPLDVDEQLVCELQSLALAFVDVLANPPMGSSLSMSSSITGNLWVELNEAHLRGRVEARRPPRSSMESVRSLTIGSSSESDERRCDEVGHTEAQTASVSSESFD